MAKAGGLRGLVTNLRGNKVSAKVRGNIIVTGYRQLDLALAQLEPKLQMKGIRKATREAAKRVVMPDIKNLVRTESYDTGAMHDAIKVRATTKSIKVKTDKVKTFTKRDGSQGKFNVQKVVGKEFGAKVEVTRKELNKQLAKRDLPQLQDDDYFYPAGVELGNEATRPVASMRQGLFQRKDRTVAIFAVELRKALTAIRAKQQTELAKGK